MSGKLHATARFVIVAFSPGAPASPSATSFVSLLPAAIEFRCKGSKMMLSHWIPAAFN